MRRRSLLTREQITAQLTTTLLPLRDVRAFWEGGAAAFGRVDRWSDLDLYILTSGRSATLLFSVVESSLRRLSGISKTYEVSSGWEGVEQKFYRLERASPFLVVDLAILTKRSQEKFLTPEVHGKNIFYIDKDGIERKLPPLPHDFERQIAARWRRLGERYEMFGNFVDKELRRGNDLEAMEEYRNIAIGTLVELLRIRYLPHHYNFRMRYVHYELPVKTLQRLERLTFVKDAADLANKNARASAWIRALLMEGPHFERRR